MSTIKTFGTDGTLAYTDVDNNFINLNNDKLERVITVNDTNPAVTITQNGSGDALDVNGNVSVSSLSIANTPINPSSMFFRNRLINGNMIFDQRNFGNGKTVVSGTTVYTLDRWIVNPVGSNVSVQKFTSSGVNYLRVTGSTGNTSVSVAQRIESFNIADLATQQVTLSIVLSSSTATSVNLYYTTPSTVDNYTTINTPVLIATQAITPTPTRYSVTFTLPSTAVNGVQVYVSVNNFTSGTLSITNAQLEAGTIPTTFEVRPASIEAINCSRYYLPYVRGISGGVCNAAGLTTGQGILIQMRAAPQLSLIYNGSINLNIFSFSTPTSIDITGSTQGSGNFLMSVTYSADAEIY